ncbi:hypothetical protein TKK_0011141 [Trichogramma kaykai]|uniref:Cwf19-like C-terminal domain-containing protein n=1 Tax=Trichogramma kaykai TaxID=54128 RepID=A0ABD2WTN6_9HYME
MSDKQKVLICGNVEGNFKFLFTKVDAINKKNGPFDFLFCVGNFFGANNSQLVPYQKGSKTIPVPTYIIGPYRPEDVEHYPKENGCEICPNLTYLGKSGVYTSSSGLKIAYLSGVQRKSPEDPEECTFSEKDVISIKNSCIKIPSFRGVDILLSSQWPDFITNLDQSKPTFEYNGSRLISWLATHIKPRYHACGMENIYYERPPYRNQNESQDGINIATRFIALATIGNQDKKKWIFAFNLTPVDKFKTSDLMMKTTDETPSPYPAALLQQNPSAKRKEEKSQFFYDMESNDKKKLKRRKVEFDKDKCWFCLDSKICSKHLIISTGNDIYLTLPRGGIVEDHFLLVPIGHHQASSVISDSARKELQAYKEAIKKYYALSDRVPVFFERNFKSSHFQIQAVPVHKNQASSLKDTFIEISNVYHKPLREMNNDLQEVAPAGTLYFYAELPDGVRLFHKIKHDFPLQFGREVCCCDRILDCPNRFDWKDCALSTEQEFMLAEKIKSKFQPFDVKTT